MIPRLPLILVSRSAGEYAAGAGCDRYEYQAISCTRSSVRQAKYPPGENIVDEEVSAPSSADGNDEMAERAGFQVTVGG